jgi:hypothetical protein
MPTSHPYHIALNVPGNDPRYRPMAEELRRHAGVPVGGPLVPVFGFRLYMQRDAVLRELLGSYGPGAAEAAGVVTAGNLAFLTEWCTGKPG